MKKQVGMRPTMRIEERKKIMGAAAWGGHLLREVDNGCYVVDSDLRGIAYVVDGPVIRVITARGGIELLRKNAEVMAKEMLGILEDVRENGYGAKLHRKD